jgi:hypothetical protein
MRFDMLSYENLCDMWHILYAGIYYKPMLRFNIFVYQNLLSVSLSSETGIKSFADGNWHTLRVNRKLNQVS